MAQLQKHELTVSILVCILVYTLLMQAVFCEMLTAQALLVITGMVVTAFESAQREAEDLPKERVNKKLYLNSIVL